MNWTSGRDYIPLQACKRGVVYRLHSRNLLVGVFDGTRGFIGIRMKFETRFLFKEYHYDTGSPYGTVFPIQEIGQVPEDIDLVEGYFPGQGPNPPDTKVYIDNKALFEFLEQVKQGSTIG